MRFALWPSEQRFGTLAASLLGNLFTGKEVIQVGQETIRAGEGAIRAGEDF